MSLKAVLIDNLEAQTISTITKIVKRTKIPTIIVCNNLYNQSFKTLIYTKNTQSNTIPVKIKLDSYTYNEAFAIARPIIVGEKIKIKESQFKQLFNSSDGDMRYMINMLQMGFYKTVAATAAKVVGFHKDYCNSNIFETCKMLMGSEYNKRSFEERSEIFRLSDIHGMMIGENYIANCYDKISASNCADAISDSDLLSRVDNEAYEVNLLRCAIMCDTNRNISFSKRKASTSDTDIDPDPNTMKFKYSDISIVENAKRKPAKSNKKLNDKCNIVKLNLQIQITPPSPITTPVNV